MNLETRIKTIEKRVFIESEELPQGIFCEVVDASLDAPPPGPVKGWCHNEFLIMRKEGESDSELSKRAFETVKDSMRPGAVPVFRSTND